MNQTPKFLRMKLFITLTIVFFLFSNLKEIENGGNIKVYVNDSLLMDGHESYNVPVVNVDTISNLDTLKVLYSHDVWYPNEPSFILSLENQQFHLISNKAYFSLYSLKKLCLNYESDGVIYYLECYKDKSYDVCNLTEKMEVMRLTIKPEKSKP